ncbi:hypothetical protein GN956_G11569 [Arapaima gigas]
MLWTSGLEGAAPASAALPPRNKALAGQDCVHYFSDEPGSKYPKLTHCQVSTFRVQQQEGRKAPTVRGIAAC